MNTSVWMLLLRNCGLFGRIWKQSRELKASILFFLLLGSACLPSCSLPAIHAFQSSSHQMNHIGIVLMNQTAKHDPRRYKMDSLLCMQCAGHTRVWTCAMVGAFGNGESPPSSSMHDTHTQNLWFTQHQHTQPLPLLVTLLRRVLLSTCSLPQLMLPGIFACILQTLNPSNCAIFSRFCDKIFLSAVQAHTPETV